MPAYLVVTYDVTNPEVYARYNPGSMPVIGATLARHGGKILAAGPGDAATWLGDQARHTFVVIEFPTVEAAYAWNDDPEYAAVAQHRIAATANTFGFIVPGFAPPA
ncbi:MAG: DUF1330 domain-containing protein [Deltaproteobacteria bacterium]|nr:DUF1330 domain-containing protein [Deltaproteobacteria bacterium]